MKFTSDKSTSTTGLGSAVAVLIVLVLVMFGVEFPDGGEAIATGAGSSVLGFLFRRYGVVKEGDTNEDGVVDEWDHAGDATDAGRDHATGLDGKHWGAVTDDDEDDTGTPRGP